MSFASRLKEKREEKGLTQVQLAKLLGLSNGAVGNYEAGISSPRAEILYKVFDVLDCDANYLFQDEFPHHEISQFSKKECQQINTLGNNIKKLRISHGLSQMELGKIAGVTDKAVSTWENGEKIPRMGAIERMASYFDIKKSEIIDDMNEKDPPAPAEPETGGDEMQAQDKELTALLAQLSPDQTMFLLAWLKTTVELDQGTPSDPPK